MHIYIYMRSARARLLERRAVLEDLAREDDLHAPWQSGQMNNIIYDQVMYNMILLC